MAEVASTLDSTLGDLLDVSIRLYRYEQLVGRAGPPQEQINPWVDACDAFIGIVHRRWGYPTESYGSGFEEEFTRALARWRTTQSPAIALFFKSVDEASLSDPGPQLARVKAFRDEVESSSLAFYKTFENTDQLRVRVQQFLIEEMHRRGRIGATGEGYSPARSGAQSANAAAEQASKLRSDLLASTLGAWAAAAAGDEPQVPLNSDRLLLFALSASRDDEEVSVHLANRLFARRSKLDLREIEARTWFKAYLADVGRASSKSERVVPFADTVGRESLAELLAEMTPELGESDELNRRRGLLRLAKLLKLRPTCLWPEDNAVSGGSALELWRSLARAATLEDAISYFVGVATASDYQLATLLRKDPDETTHRFGEVASALLSDPPDLELLAMRAPDLLLSDEMAARMDTPNPIAAVRAETLEEIVASPRAGHNVRLAAVRELAARDALSQRTFATLVKESSYDDPQESPWLESARREALERRMTPAALSSVVDALNAIKKKPTYYRQLMRVARNNPPLLEAVKAEYEFDDDQSAASPELIGLILASEEGTGALDGLAESVLDHSSVRAARYVEGLAEAGAKEDVIAFVWNRYELEALRHLAASPRTSRRRRALERLGETVKARSLFWLDALRVIVQHGSHQDVDLVASVGAIHIDGYDEVLQRLVANASLARLRNLLAGDDGRLACAALRELVRRDRAPGERVLRRLLRNTDADMRMLALEVLTLGSDRAALQEILAWYVEAESSHYYNVVCELDHMLCGVGAEKAAAASPTSR